MSKGLKLDQFKEPAFSADLKNIISEKVYIKKSQDIDDKDPEFKILFPVGYKLKKNVEVASVHVSVKAKIFSEIMSEDFGIYAPMDSIIGEPEYLLDESGTAFSYVPLNSYSGSDCQVSDYEKPQINDSGVSPMDPKTGDNAIDDYDDSIFLNVEEKLLTSEQIIQISQQAGIIDETDGRFLFIKLIEIKNSNYRNIYIDAIDDQPYVSSKEVLISKYSNAIDFAVNKIKSVFDLRKLNVLYHDVESYNLNTKIPKLCGQTNVVGVKGNYPVCPYIKNKYKYTSSIGIQALVHLARAMVNSNYRQVTTFLTICGDCIKDPCNIEVSIGTLVKDVLDKFDFKYDPKRIIIGPSITGKTVIDTSVPIKPDMRSIIAFSNFNIYKSMECIGCGKCCDVCPQGLVPIYRKKFQDTNDSNLKEFTSGNKCIECYCCTYICPSNIELL